MAKNDGGPAFASSASFNNFGSGWTSDEKFPEGFPGMSLRQYYAAAALQGFIASPMSERIRQVALDSELTDVEVLAGMSFEAADAMIRYEQSEAD